MAESQLFEIYKLHVEMTDRSSQKRSSQNQFYVTLLTGILGGLVIILDKKILQNMELIYLLSGIIGLSICLLWFSNIRSHKKLNSAKFKVLCEIEKNLSYQFYNEEWKILKKDKTYLSFTSIEKFAPFIFALPFILLILGVLFHLFRS